MKTMPRKNAVSEYLAQIGRKGGKASGKARMEKLTAEQRSEIARQAARARWKYARKRDTQGQ
jgi:general stress protein YciG